MSDLDDLLHGLDTLSSGLLSQTIIPPDNLKESLDHVKRKVIEHLKEYKLAMAEIHQYYDLPLLSFNYTDGVVILQILNCVKHHQQQTLELFSFSTVLVPYHANRKFSEVKHTYTQLKPQYDLIAMSSSAYLALNSKTLPNWRRFSRTYCYGNLLLMTHRSKHSFQSAFYCNETASLINKKVSLNTIMK